MMPQEHWFDRLQRRLAGPAARRGLLQSIGALTAGISLTANPSPSAAKSPRGNKKSKGKPHGKNKSKAKSDRPARCGEPECGLAWPVDAINRNACELKCGRCRIRSKFCIVEGDRTNPDLIATCCFEDQSCCPDPQSQSGHACVDTRSDSDHCGTCNFPCPPGLRCVDGRCLCPGDRRLCVDGCVDTQTDPRNCRECGTICPDQWTCCNADCVDTSTNANHCGQCGNPCPFGDGAPDTCCNGICTNTATNAENCGRCGRACLPDQGCCSGLCFNPADFRCCPNGTTICRTDKVCCQTDGGAWDCC